MFFFFAWCDENIRCSLPSVTQIIHFRPQLLRSHFLVSSTVCVSCLLNLILAAEFLTSVIDVTSASEFKSAYMSSYAAGLY